MTEYRIVIQDNAAEVTSEDGTPIPYLEFLNLLDLLTQARVQYRRNYLSTYLATIQQSASWVFPKGRREIYSSGGCVYFIRSAASPGRIKIGFTINLSNRTKALELEYGAPVEVLAFAKTPDYKVFEEALHTYFGESRWDTSEWFDEAPVQAYLRGLTP